MEAKKAQLLAKGIIDENTVRGPCCMGLRGLKRLICMTPGGEANLTKNCTILSGMERANCLTGSAVVNRASGRAKRLEKRTPKLVRSGYEEALVPKGGTELNKHQLAVAAMKAKSLFSNSVCTPL